MIAACEQWREPLGVAPWELQLGHAVGGNVRVDAGGVPSLSESIDVGVDDVSDLIGVIDVSNNWRFAFGADSAHGCWDADDASLRHS